MNLAEKNPDEVLMDLGTLDVYFEISPCTTAVPSGKTLYSSWRLAAILKIRDFLTFDTKGLELSVIPQFWLLNPF